MLVLVLCVCAQDMHGGDMHGGDMSHQHNSSSGSGSTDMCVNMPSHSGCMHYELPAETVTADVDSLCAAMPFMTGCSLRSSCASGLDSRYPEYCAEFAILGSLCHDMPGMAGCSNYVSMCAEGSVVESCDTPFLPLPGTMATEADISQMCSSHAMGACAEYFACSAQGPAGCDLLSTYSDVCLSHTGMPECASHREMCALVPASSYCNIEDSDYPVVMRMYFHTGLREYILFEGWVPETEAEFAGSWFAVFFMGIFLEFLRAVRAFFEYRMSPSKCACADSVKSFSTFVAERPLRPAVDFMRSCLHLVDVCWALLLMLVAMTFNVALFFAVVIGAAFGNLIFGRFYMTTVAGPACH